MSHALNRLIELISSIMSTFTVMYVHMKAHNSDSVFVLELSDHERHLRVMRRIRVYSEEWVLCLRMEKIAVSLPHSHIHADA